MPKKKKKSIKHGAYGKKGASKAYRDMLKKAAGGKKKKKKKK